MTDAEMKFFLEEMKQIGDVWTEKEAAQVYGNQSLEAALQDRRTILNECFQIMGKVLNR